MISGLVSTPTDIYLSDLAWESATNGWGDVELDMSNGEELSGDGNLLTLNGFTYRKGLGVHSDSEVVYALNGNYTTFTADIGVDDEVGSNGSVVFQVWADGIQLFDSGVMTGDSATQSVEVDVADRQNLELRVTNAGDGFALDHANWADARLLVANPSDSTPPTAILTADDLSESTSSPYQFTVTYSDEDGVNLGTIDDSDIQVIGPNGFSQLAQLVGITSATDNTSVEATYAITAPDSIWNWNDRGNYSFSLLAGEIQDSLGDAAILDTALGSFTVSIASTIVLGRNSSQVTEGDTVTIPVQRLGDTTGTATINYFTGGNSTAVSGVNYVPIPVSTLTFAPGETQGKIFVETLDDGVDGTDVSVSLLIESPSGADLGPSRTSRITIEDAVQSEPVITYLSDLNWVSADNDWGPVELDSSNGEEAAGDGRTLTLNGTTFEKGLGVHASSTIIYDLDGSYDKFVASIGVDDEVGSEGSVIFEVWADDTQLFVSNVMTGNSATKLVNVDLTDRQSLTLIVTDAGDGPSYDHANWADARLIVGDYEPPAKSDPLLPTIERTQIVSSLNQPTTLDWSPDGQLMFIAEKGGIVKVFSNGLTTSENSVPIGLQSEPFIDLSDQVNNVSDRGLLGLTVDPLFGQSQGRDFIYLSFTYDPPETWSDENLQNSATAPDGNGNRPARLIRVTADPSTNYTTAIPGSEVVLLGKNSNWEYTSRPDIDSTDNFSILPSGIANDSTVVVPAELIEDPDPVNFGNDYSSTDTDFENNNNIRDYIAGDSQSHSIGQVQFGSDGMLYVAIGDGTSYNGVDWRSTRVQDVDNLSGKLLRIDPMTGEGLPDNPFYDGDPNSNRSKVWSLGLRNPFRFTVDEETGNPYIGDVGWTTWEEINVATGGDNFGWPYFEGEPQNLGYSTLPQAQAFYASGAPITSPLLSRHHDAGQNADGLATTALIMGDFYTGDTLPSEYDGSLFYNDVGLGTIYVTFLNPDATVDFTRAIDSLPYVVDMETGPDGYLYYVSLFSGEIGRWESA